MKETESETRYTISQAARLLGVSTSTLRNWERKGIEPAPDRTPTGERRYTQEQIDQLRNPTRGAA